MNKPLRHVICIWVFVYPIVTTLLFGLQKLDVSLSIQLKSLIMTLILVPLMYFCIVPSVNRLLSIYSD